MAATHNKDLTTFDLPTWVYKPDGFDAAAIDHYPVLIYLHGSGVKGNGIDSILTDAAPTPASEIDAKINTSNWDHNFIVLSPYRNGDWFPAPLSDFIQSVVDNKDLLKIDTNKIVLTGLSLGGIGISQFIQDPAANNRYIPLLAAFPVAGGSQSGNDAPADAVARNIFIKGWYGENDSETFSNPKMISDRDEMNAIEADYYELTEIAGGTHSALTWGKVYNRQDANATSFDIYEYMDSQILPPDTTPPLIPSGLTASNIGKHSFSVDWSASTDTGSTISYYSVYLDDVLVYSGDVLTYTFDYALKPSTAYSVTVSATDGEGNTSSLSSPLEVNTLDDAAAIAVGGNSSKVML